MRFLATKDHWQHGVLIMRKMAIVLGVSLMSANCATVCDCERAIAYQGSTIKIAGIPGIDIGSASYTRESIRQSIRLIEAADLEQYNSCRAFDRFSALYDKAKPGGSDRIDLSYAMNDERERQEESFRRLQCYIAYIETGVQSQRARCD